MQKPAASPGERDFTIPGLLALFGIVLVTALFFAQPNVAERASSSNLYGSAVGLTQSDPDAPASCNAYSYCDGTKLVRQQDDCRQFVSFCKYGCEERADGAICR